MAENDPAVAHPQHLGSANVIVITGAQEFRPHHAYKRHPAEDDGNA